MFEISEERKQILKWRCYICVLSGHKAFECISSKEKCLYSRLPNGQMLNRWLSEKNILIVLWLRFRGAKQVKKCCMFCIL